MSFFINYIESQTFKIKKAMKKQAAVIMHYLSLFSGFPMIRWTETNTARWTLRIWQIEVWGSFIKRGIDLAHKRGYFRLKITLFQLHFCFKELVKPVFSRINIKKIYIHILGLDWEEIQKGRIFFLVESSWCPIRERHLLHCHSRIQWLLR